MTDPTFGTSNLSDLIWNEKHKTRKPKTKQNINTAFKQILNDRKYKVCFPLLFMFEKKKNYLHSGNVLFMPWSLACCLYKY